MGAEDEEDDETGAGLVDLRGVGPDDEEGDDGHGEGAGTVAALSPSQNRDSVSVLRMEWSEKEEKEGLTKARTRTTKPASKGERPVVALRGRRCWSDEDWPARKRRGWRKQTKRVQASKNMVIERKIMARTSSVWML